MERQDLVIIGTGGFAREVLWLLCEANDFISQYNIKGFIDNDLKLKNHVINGIPILGDDDWLKSYSKEICAVICIGDSKTRKHIHNKLKVNSNLTFPTIISDNTKYSNSVKFGQGCIICMSNVLTVDITIGDFVVINLDCTVGHNSILDDFVTLNPSVNVSGNVRIGACTNIGTGANIIQGISIGENTTIGAGAVVIKDIPSNCIAVGVPAIPIKTWDE